MWKPSRCLWSLRSMYAQTSAWAHIHTDWQAHSYCMYYIKLCDGNFHWAVSCHTNFIPWLNLWWLESLMIRGVCFLYMLNGSQNFGSCSHYLALNTLCCSFKFLGMFCFICAGKRKPWKGILLYGVSRFFCLLVCRERKVYSVFFFWIIKLLKCKTARAWKTFSVLCS